jgi:hypothetical protein
VPSSILTLAVAVLAAATTGLAGWVYSTGAKVAALEAGLSALAQTSHETREDVRDLRTALLGPRPPVRAKE